MIEAINVNYIYQPGTPFEKKVLTDINLEIPDGSLTAIIGHTGSGKSTLIQHFNALIKPTSGKILIDGTDITSKDADLKRIRCMTGLVFQYPEHQLFEETVYEDIAFGPKNMGLSDVEIDERVKNAMLMTGLDEKYAHRSPFELSGGQKRRAAIAGVLAMKPSALILDEPAAGLDPKGRDDMLVLIKSLHEKNPKMIIIFVSHSMEDVAKTAQNVIVLNSGRVAMQGSVNEVFSHSGELVKMGLNIPQITQLTEKLRILGYPVPEGIYTVQHAAEILKKLIGSRDNA